MSTFEIILTAIGSGISGGVLTQFLKLKKGKADFYKDEIEYLTQRLAKYKEENKILKDRLDQLEREIKDFKMNTNTVKRKSKTTKE